MPLQSSNSTPRSSSITPNAASKAARISWGKMIENYLHRSEQLKTVFLLTDIRHKPSENDRMMYDWIADRGLRAVIIATKSDKINRSQLAGRVREIRETLGCPADTPVIPFSAETRAGRHEIFAEIVRSMEQDAGEEETGTQEIQ